MSSIIHYQLVLKYDVEPRPFLSLTSPSFAWVRVVGRASLFSLADEGQVWEVNFARHEYYSHELLNRTLR